MKIFYRLVITLSILFLIVGALGTVKWLQFGRMNAHSESFVPPPKTITSVTVERFDWENTIRAVGSVEAVQGIMVAAELSGKVKRIALTPGEFVKAGQLLLQQDVSVERAQLRAAESDVQLTTKNLERTRRLYDQKLATRAVLDEQKSALDRASAQVDFIKATLNKKTIRAPFAGRLGVCQVDLGEVLTTGQPIVTLQALDSVFVNFFIPQQNLSKLKPGLTVNVSSDLTEDRSIEGKITVISPEVDPQSRNVRVQARVANLDEILFPGMYATVEVVLPERVSVLAIPATSVRYAPYSDSVFVVEPAEGQENETDPKLLLRQQFVQLGAQKGDFVTVLQGLEKGQKIVSTGVFKLRNGQSVVVDNRLSPSFDLKPNPDNA